MIEFFEFLCKLGFLGLLACGIVLAIRWEQGR
jgi:hypothetical protein